MCDFIDCEKWKELDCSQFNADIFCRPTCYRPLKAKTESGAQVPYSGGLSDAERDMDMIFCVAIARTFTFGSSEMCNLLDEYRALMKNKEEVLKKIKGG